MMDRHLTLVLICLFAIRSASAMGNAMDWHEPWRLPASRVPAEGGSATLISDEYAWRLFVALNWPADVTRRTADPRAVLGAPGPVTWETWQNAADVYLEHGKDPGPWALGQQASGAAYETRFETASLNELKKTRHIVAGVMVPLADPLAQVQRLIEVRMNRISFDYVRSHELYNVEGQLHAVASGRAVTFPYGALQIKASWRPIAERDRSRYHTITVQFANGTARLYGLTALNIAAKEMPNWLWASFEHVDNATRENGEGWQLPSRDSFACRNESDCNRAPSGVGLEGTVWENYRLRGTLTSFVDANLRPRLLANSELEAGLQMSASCITCHSRASIGLIDGHPARLPVFVPTSADGRTVRRGYVGLPRSETGFKSLDFVWSLSQAKSRTADANSGDSP
jgi:hypothetical protein